MILSSCPSFPAFARPMPDRTFECAQWVLILWISIQKLLHIIWQGAKGTFPKRLTMSVADTARRVAFNHYAAIPPVARGATANHGRGQGEKRELAVLTARTPGCLPDKESQHIAMKPAIEVSVVVLQLSDPAGGKFLIIISVVLRTFKLLWYQTEIIGVGTFLRALYSFADQSLLVSRSIFMSPGFRSPCHRSSVSPASILFHQYPSTNAPESL